MIVLFGFSVVPVGLQLFPERVRFDGWLGSYSTFFLLLLYLLCWALSLRSAGLLTKEPETRKGALRARLPFLLQSVSFAWLGSAFFFLGCSATERPPPPHAAGPLPLHSTVLCVARTAAALVPLTWTGTQILREAWFMIL